jgi:uncharacterized membrane protein YgaE (UPF0421/DUF939 family)
LIPTDPISLRFAARITIAAMAAYLVALAFELPEALWAVITGLIVVQMSVGGTIGAGLDRLVGTLAGALVGGAAATAHALWPALPVGLLLMASVAPLSLFVVKRPTYRVAPVTAALMLLLVHDHGEVQPLRIALDRVFEIAIGCVIGIAVSLLVLPYRAEQQLADRVASGLRLLAQLVIVQLGARAPADLARIDALNERLRLLLAGCETTAVDVRREHKMHLGGRRDPEPLFRTLRRLRSDVAILDRAMSQLVADGAAPAALGPLAQALADWLEPAAGALARRTPPPPLDPIDGATAAAFGGGQVPERLLSLWFAIEALRRDCGDLHDRMAERAAEQREHALPSA